VQKVEIGRRVNVCGTSGSGKSTLGRALAERLGVPFIEMDALRHGPNWTMTPDDVFRERVDEATRGDGWVIDGNYGLARDFTWARAQTVIWLDYPLPLVFWRMTKRILSRCLRREELWHGNRERLAVHLFTRESLWWWVLTTHRRRRRQADELFSNPQYGHLNRIRLYSPKDAERLLESLR
jgi:adenylate kinase family enzyme